jgi:RNA polymerase sigma factor (sigma-70 family)
MTTQGPLLDWLRGVGAAASPPAELDDSPLYATLWRICRARAARWHIASDARDAFHEAMIRLNQQLARNPGLASLPMDQRQRYALTVIRNVISEFARARKREAHHESISTTQPDIPDSSAVPDTLQSCLEHCLAEAEESSREMLRAYYADKGTEPRTALASRLGCTLTTLRVRVNRARAQLKQCLHRCSDSGEAAV